MIIWAFIVFGFGVTLFLVYILNLFDTFAPWIWSIILFVIAIGMLNRIWHKEKEAEKEKLAEMVAALEEKLKENKD
jgi:4-hydroxybenzoate polyprenyltransferase